LRSYPIRFALLLHVAAATPFPCQDPAPPIPARVSDPLGWMTPNEKFRQLFLVVGDLAPDSSRLTRGLFGMRSTCISNRPRVSTAIALETKARGIRMVLSPMVNLATDGADLGGCSWDLRKDAVARVVRDLHPQVIGLQEALSHQLTYLDAQWPGYQRFGVGREDGVAKGEFGPVYFDTTVFSLLDGRTIWLSETPDAPGKGWDAACERIATLVMLRDKTKGDSLLVVNTH
jgi:hypothetical protein